ncbi:7095_t:CDS:2 [Ambispora gerdemannii]|uniref:7095_t:CDS:1 n=1 Tax=Ambispora gerdemannii TaxID=144530 RepID=A0A9N8YZH5_9GLOM|nr:7095_t:CDS:2 [Ambispora gerdemannii]
MQPHRPSFQSPQKNLQFSRETQQNWTTEASPFQHYIPQSPNYFYYPQRPGFPGPNLLQPSNINQHTSYSTTSTSAATFEDPNQTITHSFPGDPNYPQQIPQQFDSQHAFVRPSLPQTTFSFQHEAPPGVTLESSLPKDKQNSSAEQLWLKSWLKSHNIRFQENSFRLPRISDARKKVLRAQALRKELDEQLEALKVAKGSANEKEWELMVSKIEKIKSEYESNMNEILNKEFQTKLKQKISKIRRHKKWQKQHIKKLQNVRDERRRRRETLHKTIDEWRTEWIAKELAFKREQARKENAEKRVEEAEANKNRHKELSRLLEQVKKLRDLRRERLKREGHFFPEEDNEFFNKVASLNDAMKIEEERLEKERNAAAEQKRDEAMDAGMKERERERDPLYEYWHQAEFDLDNLVSIRRQWDAYIVPAGTQGASRIPPRFVTPTPPANYIWASCLTHGNS